MPAFELLVPLGPEDLPDAVAILEARQASGTVKTNGGNVAQWNNLARDSVRAKQIGDKDIARWWDAVPMRANFPPAYDTTAFGGAGGISFTSEQELMFTEEDFPVISTGTWHINAVADHPVVDGHGTVFEGAEPSTKYIYLSLDEAGFSNHVAYHYGTSGAVDVAPPYASFASTHLGLSGTTGIVIQNGLVLGSGAYATTGIGGFGDIGVGGENSPGAKYFTGKLARLLLYKRSLLLFELLFLDDLAYRYYGAPVSMPGGLLGFPFHPRFAPPQIGRWKDTQSGSTPSRINSVTGHDPPFYLVERDGSGTASVLVMAMVNGAIDTSSGYECWYLEWPRKSIGVAAPPILQDLGASGMCQLQVPYPGHYVFELWKAGSGAVLLHLDVI